MVDVVASSQASNDAETSDVRDAAVVIHTDRTAALAAYETFPAVAFSPSQSSAWIAAWAEEAHADLVVATLSSSGQSQMALALEVVRSGPFRVARFAGGRHANGNFPPVAAGDEINRASLGRLFAAIARERPDIDLIALERLADSIDGIANPLLALPHAPSPNLALAVNLNGGFEALLARASGKRKRKKHRSQTRKFDAVGGYRLLTAKTREESDRLLGEFFEMKHKRFATMGVADVFAEPGVKAFFRRLFAEALIKEQPDFVLDALEVGGTLRAVTGSSRCGSRLICEFGAIREDELAQASPGDFLFFENIQRACNDGFAIYDFSVGDEHYKRMWCDIESRQFDVLVPLTAKGRLLALARRAITRGKSWVKNNSAAWAVVKKFRRHGAKQTETAQHED